MTDDKFWSEIIILRCDCNDWPTHRYFAYAPAACPVCGSICNVVDELYPEEKYARNSQ